MSKEDTKRHFAEICETIWSKIEHQERLEKATAEKMRQIVANMAMIAWNMCLIHKSADETKKALRDGKRWTRPIPLRRRGLFDIPDDHQPRNQS